MEGDQATEELNGMVVIPLLLLLPMIMIMSMTFYTVVKGKLGIIIEAVNR